MRKIKIGLLGMSGVVYRIHIVMVQSVYWYFFFGITKDIWTWKWAISSSIIWNAFNTVLYYNYHYWFAKLFKIGK